MLVTLTNRKRGTSCQVHTGILSGATIERVRRELCPGEILCAGEPIIPADFDNGTWLAVDKAGPIRYLEIGHYHESDVLLRYS